MELKAPPATALVRAFRLRLCIRIAVCSPPHLLATLNAASDAPRSWVNSVQDDLRYFSQHVPAHKLPSGAFSDVFAMFRAQPQKWRSRIKQCLSSDALLQPESWEISPSRSLLGDMLLCDDCHMIFPSLSRLNSHRSSVHGHLSPARDYVDSTVCLACL